MNAPIQTQLQKGAALIAQHVKTLPNKSGVYQMLNARGDRLYVGKAKSLKKRVVAYTRPEKLSVRLQRMISETTRMEFITTHTEVEALLLEANLIKKYSPRYNILLKDDKSYTYIFIQGTHPWPQIRKHRGAQKEKGDYYGPFASVEAVNETLTTLHRAFRLRSCTDTIFASRTRPCLQYHIKRCAAPCVNRINAEDYADALKQAKHFLKGKSAHIQRELAHKMQTASHARAYEQAALYRDRIRALTQVQHQQTIYIPGLPDADAIAGFQEGGQTCLQVFFFRNGSNYGSRSFFPQHPGDTPLEDVISAFLGQFYEQHPAPPEILINCPLPEQTLIEKALSQKAGTHVTLSVPHRGKKRDLMRHALDNAQESLRRKMAESATQKAYLKGLARRLKLPGTLHRVEVYDNSHTQGTFSIGGMIVAGPEGFIKPAYRQYKIRTTQEADDYAMMREVLTRRFRKSLAQDLEQQTVPDLVIIDGGLGHLTAAMETLADLGLGDLPLLAIAKGAERTPGKEKIYTKDRILLTFPKNDKVFYFLQRLRDEAHRFAIGTHRQRRQKALGRSLLDDIPGIGAIRKKTLLNHFGSAVAVSRAGLPDLRAVKGISAKIAETVYEHFHSS